MIFACDNNGNAVDHKLNQATGKASSTLPCLACLQLHLQPPDHPSCLLQLTRDFFLVQPSSFFLSTAPLNPMSPSSHHLPQNRVNLRASAIATPLLTVGLVPYPPPSVHPPANPSSPASDSTRMLLPRSENMTTTHLSPAEATSTFASASTPTLAAADTTHIIPSLTQQEIVRDATKLPHHRELSDHSQFSTDEGDKTQTKSALRSTFADTALTRTQRTTATRYRPTSDDEDNTQDKDESNEDYQQGDVHDDDAEGSDDDDGSEYEGEPLGLSSRSARVRGTMTTAAGTLGTMEQHGKDDYWGVGKMAYDKMTTRQRKQLRFVRLIFPYRYNLIGQIFATFRWRLMVGRALHLGNVFTFPHTPTTQQ